MCTGCGAFTQTSDPQQLGYFDSGSRRIRNWLSPPTHEKKDSASDQDKLVNDALRSLESGKIEALGLSPAAMGTDEESQTKATAVLEAAKPPVCGRCHNLQHYSTKSETAKMAMHHPTVESLRATIEESPHSINHIIHVIDAADFPMSLIPRLHVLLGNIRLRSQNRRSKSLGILNGRKTDMSFIITRSDLLGPTKEIVDSMMPYLQEVLRDSLGRNGDKVRLGNVKCVSARRGWWTNPAKEDIWRRGGAAWLVGKVNVGKSQLFEAVYPKGRMTQGKVVQGKLPSRATTATSSFYDAFASARSSDGRSRGERPRDDLVVGELLPPPRPAENYPAMPVVSPLPGTTASPIRLPFGDGKGELIDLPGLARSNLELFVKEEHRQSLIMKKRIVPEQRTVKAGKSLLLGGGLIRITPRTDDIDFLVYNFTPLDDHLTATEKAIGFQNQTQSSVGLENITLPGVGAKMKHAGTFKLCHDVTKKRAGPLTRKDAVGLRVDTLPFRVISVDILIESVGYVEIVAQVRARDFDAWTTAQQRADARAKNVPGASDDPYVKILQQRWGYTDAEPFSRPAKLLTWGSEPVREAPAEPESEPGWPAIDVFTPEGQFVASRKPINGWENNKPRVLAEHKKSRPRRSMKGDKKKMKEATKPRRMAWLTE
ncbi:hypothetical protein HRG_002447 [Hirsutella rhossiliensis]|uniref:Genetic interactor of prohibitins 3, mitochondrial n=1 Tax=Hirsutella rhossiliensis TaxID=111463 RepID=A0A9P8SL30_9HYPO|nr:uncharacterized protein HRG_02447 [Hirsutella rhossiliensis]KAH0967038.1 hypothetical protein HRG_02447 [Hirsutella rhossiliensis]